VGIDFEAQVIDEEGPHTVFRKVWRQPVWYPAAADLGPWAGKDVTLRLITRPWYDRMGHEYCYWGDPRVVAGDLLSPDPADRKTILRLYDAGLYEGTTPTVRGAFREGFWAMPAPAGGETIRRFDMPVALPAGRAGPPGDDTPWRRVAAPDRVRSGTRPPA